jgi:hypothetical protein
MLCTGLSQDETFLYKVKLKQERYEPILIRLTTSVKCYGTATQDAKGMLLGDSRNILTNWKNYLSVTEGK